MIVGTNAKKEIVISWATTPYDCKKINMDGVARGNSGATGPRGIIRDYNGNLVANFAKPLGVCNAKSAEVQGVYNGLRLAWDLGIKRAS